MRTRRARQPARHRDRRDAARHHRKPDRDFLWPVMGAGGFLRLSAADACIPPIRNHGAAVMRNSFFIAAACLVALLIYALARIVNNDYLFFAGYVVLQFVVLATAWNILGG